MLRGAKQFQKSKICFGSALIGALISSVVFAQTKPPLPSTSGQWAVAKTPSVEFLGARGYNSALGDIELGNLPVKIYIDKNLAEVVKAKTVSVTEIETFTPKEWDIDLEPVVQAYREEPLTAVDLSELSRKLTLLLQDAGYPASVMFNLKLDRIEIRVEPLRIRNVDIADSKWIKARAIHHRFDVHPGDEVDVAHLKRQMKYIQENPDIQLETVLEPVEFSKDVDLKIKISDNLPFHVQGSWDNYDQRIYGDSIMGMGAIHNNITGHADSLMIAPLFDPQSYGFFGRYEIPVGSHGTRIGSEFSWIKAIPNQIGYRDFGIRGDAVVVTPFIIQDLIRRENTRLSSDLSFDFQEFDTEWDGGDLEREAFRDFRLGLQLEHDGRLGSTAIRNELATGFDILGATGNGRPLLSRVGGGSQFLRYLMTLYHLVDMPFGTAGIFNSTFQYSPDRLNNVWLYASGGTFYGRGYREYFYNADTAAYFSFQWEMPAYFIPRKWKLPQSEETLQKSIHLVSFIDYCWTHLNDETLSADSDEQILGIGGGIRAKLSKFIEGRLDIGFPLLRQAPNKNSPRLYFGVKANVI